MKYPINEIFYSLKGEGRWTGTPMLFIRLYGCNLKCKFCDTESKCTEELSAVEISRRLYELNPTCRRVVITGGEPTIHDLTPLIDELQLYDVHLETNGTNPVNPGDFDWIAVSPKGRELNPYTLQLADEIKFLYGEPYEEWEELIKHILKDHTYIYGRRLIQPISKPYEGGQRGPEQLIDEHVQRAIEYCKQHPTFSLCMQMHKIWRIP